MAYAAYGLADFLVLSLCYPQAVKGVFTDSSLWNIPGNLVLYIKSGFFQEVLAPLRSLPFLAGGVAICLRRRWTLWAVGAWALACLLGWLSVMTRVFMLYQATYRPLWYSACLLAIQLPYHLVLPAVVLYFLYCNTTRRQFRQWADDVPVVGRPVWPTVIGWLSMFHSLLGLACFISNMGLRVVDHYVFYSAFCTFWGPGLWSVLDRISGILPFLAVTALAFPAIALLKRRPNAAILHVMGAVIVLGSLLLEPLVDALSPYRLLRQAPSLVDMEVVLRMFVRSIYPMFLLFWFLRPAIRSQVAGWPRPGRAGIIHAERE
jgi:hypothetical protein